MSSHRTDIVVVGGGLAGSSLCIALSRRGIGVLLLEAEARFRDRVRGEALLPWGVGEARKLGIFELLLEAGARPLAFRDTYVAGERRSRHLFSQESRSGEAPLGFQHVFVQEALIRAAADAGARVIRGARLHHLTGGCDPAVEFEIDGRVDSASAGLVVGADGRSSRVRALAGFEVNRGAQGLVTAGVALQGLTMDDDALAFTFNARERKSAVLIPQGDGKARAYLTYSTDEPRQRAVRHVAEFVERLVAGGLPAGALAATAAAGPLATFDGTPKWVETPHRDGVVLIGDAAGTPDPAWGQGMSLALRDVNVLVNAISSNIELREAASRYATDHSRYSATDRIVSRLATQAQFGLDAEAGLLRSSALWRHSARRIKAVHLDGPDVDLRELLLPGFVADKLAPASTPTHSAAAVATTC